MPKHLSCQKSLVFLPADSMNNKPKSHLNIPQDNYVVYVLKQLYSPWDFQFHFISWCRSFRASITDTINSWSLTLCCNTKFTILIAFSYKTQITISSMLWPDRDRLRLQILIQILDSRDVTCQVFFLCASVGDLSQEKVHSSASVSAWLSYSCEKMDPFFLLHSFS